MNKIILRGILKNIEHSHSMNGIEYSKAIIITKRTDGKEDIVNLKFKEFSNKFKENEFIELTGNVRTFNYIDENKNRVELYVFTYFDYPEETDSKETNYVELDGTICKSNGLRKTKNNNFVLDFILANNIVNGDKALNAYIPVVAWGKLAREINDLPIGTKIKVIGSLHSREYKKIINNDIEIKIAHEININNYEKLN